MALSNELSSEIAVAMLSGTNKSPCELKDLQEVVFRVHTILRQMEDQAEAARQHRKGGPTKTSAATSA